jgi:hypothetical protein
MWRLLILAPSDAKSECSIDSSAAPDSLADQNEAGRMRLLGLVSSAQEYEKE